MATCPGRRNGSNCGVSQVYRCKNCGSVGCTAPGCTNQNFDVSSRCLKCGKQDGKVSV